MSSTTGKVAISIDSELLEEVERLRAKTGESRSAIIRRALIMLTAEETHSADVRRYVEAYREVPETREDVESARLHARRTLSLLDWDES